MFRLAPTEGGDESIRSDAAQRLLSEVEKAVHDGFATPLRTGRMVPMVAAEVLCRLPADHGFQPTEVAAHVRKLPPNTGEAIRLDRTRNATILSVAIPGDRRVAFDWAHELLQGMAASGVKMNLGPYKATDLKIFWGTADVNTLVDAGADV